MGTTEHDEALAEVRADQEQALAHRRAAEDNLRAASAHTRAGVDVLKARAAYWHLLGAAIFLLGTSGSVAIVSRFVIR